MNLKNKWKRFWTMDVHNHEGFTLVELIIVIAILAILSSVAVVGYSSSVKKANKQADLTLAADIENALIMAMYSGTLTPGDYVVVQFNGNASCGNGEVDSTTNKDSTIYKAMAAAYGDDWEKMLALKWNGWAEEIGVAGDKFTMDTVKNSNFTPEDDNLNVLLGQLQWVVKELNPLLADKPVNADIAEMLNNNGIPVTEGDTFGSNAQAGANAYVYFIAGNLADVNITDFENAGDSDLEFLNNWCLPDDSDTSFKGTSTWDMASAEAAEYARVYALATYIDKQSGGTTNYLKDLEVTGNPCQAAVDVLAAIKNDASVKAAYDAYYEDDGEGSIAYNDAVAFLAYMQGVTDSSDSLLKNTDLRSDNYYNDGYIADYVYNYMDLSDALTANGVSGSAFAFIYTGTEILCMPLDW